jgi:hypothetical protein
MLIRTLLLLIVNYNAAIATSLYDPTVPEIWKQLSYSDNPIETINEFISKFPLDDNHTLSDSTHRIIRVCVSLCVFITKFNF